MTDTSEMPEGPDNPEPVRDEEAFHIPDDLARALTEFAAVEQLSRGEAICLVLREYLRAKGYLKGAATA
ncbi:ribbon-helix-helix domain-containing protein [Methylobacterium sp. EM32]|uniref:ribbon-helix-helix domain-containing protein n=1 Tax=Methylobacterium sp. EM32 TaxID=3163481 RepID=UPI0033AF50E5